MVTTGGGGAPAPPPGTSYPSAQVPGTQVPGGPNTAAPTAAKPPSICIIPGCTKPKYMEGTQMHDFCSRTCAKKGAGMGLPVTQTTPAAGQATAQPAPVAGVSANSGPPPSSGYGPPPAGYGPPPSSGYGPPSAGSVNPPGT